MENLLVGIGEFISTSERMSNTRNQPKMERKKATHGKVGEAKQAQCFPLTCWLGFWHDQIASKNQSKCTELIMRQNGTKLSKMLNENRKTACHKTRI